MSQIKTFIGFLESITTEDNAHLLEGVKCAANKMHKKEKKAKKLEKFMEAWEKVTPEQKKLMAGKFDIKGDKFAQEMVRKAVAQMSEDDDEDDDD